MQNNKIQASVPFHLVRRFSDHIREKEIYVIYYFRVIHNLKASIVSHNNRRLIFCKRTKIYPSQSLAIDAHGLSFVSANEILARKHNIKCLVDTIGVLLTFQFDTVELSPPRFSPGVKFEVADQSGRVACSLSGKYVSEFRKYLSTSSNAHPVVILQFAKISTERGYTCLENLKDVTKIMINPPIHHVLQFNIRLSNSGGVYSLIHGKHSNSVVVTDITPFDRFYPHKTVREFIDTQESGFFVLCARVVGIFHINKWWYPVCKCGNFLDIWVGCYFCVQCNIHVFCVSSMFKLQIAIDDGTSTVLIQSTHSPLRGIHCLNHSSLGIEHALAHYGSKAFEGKEILFIARKTSRSEYRFEDYVEIINMTDEEGSVRRFHELGNNFTPTKSIYIDPFAQLDVEAHDSVLVSSVQKFITKGKKPLIDLETPSNFSCVTTGSFSTSNLIKARKKLSYAFSECTGERNIFEC
ncbi:unnamed protein product [Trifolium pratense]|uniref:Uncharacterized protein n=1 Tax=Trifolium pratense TaxID=57577 RepID=A0ACB0L4D5_TRIPR|nr:unnamed protein product [Trifolium pratense]